MVEPDRPRTPGQNWVEVETDITLARRRRVADVGCIRTVRHVEDGRVKFPGSEGILRNAGDVIEFGNFAVPYVPAR